MRRIDPYSSLCAAGRAGRASEAREARASSRWRPARCFPSSPFPPAPAAFSPLPAIRSPQISDLFPNHAGQPWSGASALWDEKGEERAGPVALVDG